MIPIPLLATPNSFRALTYTALDPLQVLTDISAHAATAAYAIPAVNMERVGRLSLCTSTTTAELSALRMPLQHIGTT